MPKTKTATYNVYGCQSRITVAIAEILELRKSTVNCVEGFIIPCLGKTTPIIWRCGVESPTISKSTVNYTLITCFKLSLEKSSRLKFKIEGGGGL